MAKYKIKLTDNDGSSFIVEYPSAAQARKVLALYQAQHDRNGGHGWGRSEYLGRDAARSAPYCPRKAGAAAAAGRR